MPPCGCEPAFFYRFFINPTNYFPETGLDDLYWGIGSDTNVASKVNYYYVVTAVNRIGKESAYSNQASAMRACPGTNTSRK